MSEDRVDAVDMDYVADAVPGCGGPQDRRHWAPLLPARPARAG